MTDYEYDKNLPYVLVAEGEEDEGRVIARFAEKRDADYSIFRSFLGRVIDTTPKPRVPEDAKYVTWLDIGSGRWFAERKIGGWAVDGALYGPLDALPGVTPSTVFAVLDAREETT